MPTFEDNLRLIEEYSSCIRTLGRDLGPTDRPTATVVDAVREVMLQVYGTGTASHPPEVRVNRDKVEIVIPIRLIGSDGMLSHITFRFNSLAGRFKYAIDFHGAGGLSHCERSSAIGPITSGISQYVRELCRNHLFNTGINRARQSVDNDPVSLADRRGE
jgi:hypothetical protein